MSIEPSMRWVAVFIVALFFYTESAAQNQTNNYGKEFRFTFLENNGALEKVSFNVSCEKKNFILRITCGIYKDTFIVRSKDTTLFYLKTGSPNTTVFFPGRSILITSSEPITLTALNNSLNSTDISSIIPSEKIPGNPIYYLNTYRGDESLGKANNSLFSVVAIDDSCMINILPSCDSKNNLYKNTLYTVLLRKGQVYQEQALDSQSFAGTKIWNTKGCKRFSVFEGAKCSYVEYNNATCKGCDHLYNQSRPTQYLGTKFTTIPFNSNTGGYLYQIVATENNTQVSVNGIPVVTMNEGEVHTVNQKSNVALCIQSDKKISVVELMKSGECNGHSNLLGNPSLMTIVPDDQMTVQAAFSFPSTKNISMNPSFPAEFYLAVVAKTGNLSKVKLNGVQLDTLQFKTACNLSLGTFKLNPTLNYHLSSTDGFIAYMYAVGLDESYATEVGYAFENKSTELLISANTTSVCDSFHQFDFQAKSDSSATYRWSFGDGSSDNGSTVSKIYNKTGVFKLKLNVNYTSNKGCVVDSFERTIKINSKPYFSFGPDTSICNGVFFEISPLAPPKVSYKWFNGSQSSIYTINSSGTVWLTLTDSNLCRFSDTMSVKFINCDTSNVVIPNVFTPGKSGDEINGDNINDVFETRFSGFDQLNGLIYNRWGVVVYDFSYPTNSYWNGSFMNDNINPCPAGTYYYIFTYKNNSSGLTRTINGVVELIR